MFHNFEVVLVAKHSVTHFLFCCEWLYHSANATNSDKRGSKVSSVSRPTPIYGSNASESVTLGCRKCIFFSAGSSLYSNETSAEPHKMAAWFQSHEEEEENILIGKRRPLAVEN